MLCKFICLGCDYANKKREMEQGLEQKCAFCREPVPETEEKNYQNMTKRVEANDPVAIREMGKRHRFEGDYEGAFEYLTKAAELGDIDAHFNLSIMYRLGECVEKDMKKEIYHLEEAAIGGHPEARFNIAARDWNNGRYERAMKHWIISCIGSVEEGVRSGIRKQRERALRGHQAAVDATKSEQREEAYAFFEEYREAPCDEIPGVIFESVT